MWKKQTLHEPQPTPPTLKAKGTQQPSPNPLGGILHVALRNFFSNSFLLFPCYWISGLSWLIFSYWYLELLNHVNFIYAGSFLSPFTSDNSWKSFGPRGDWTQVTCIVSPQVSVLFITPWPLGLDSGTLLATKYFWNRWIPTNYFSKP